jgi:hypothetical protein
MLGWRPPNIMDSSLNFVDEPNDGGGGRTRCNDDPGFDIPKFAKNHAKRIELLKGIKDTAAKH